MGSGADPAAAALPDREPSELVGLRLPQPAVEPAAGDAVARRRHAVDGPPAGPVAAQPAGGPGRPPLRSGVRTHGGSTQVRSAAPAARCSHRRCPAVRRHAAGPQPRRAPRRRGPDRGPPPAVSAQVSARDAVKRRRANVLFVLVLVAACSLFLAATTKAEAMLYVFGVAFVALCGYVYVLGQLRQREQQPPAELVVPAVDAAPAAPPAAHRGASFRRRTGATVRPADRRDRWSHAV